MAGSSRFTSFNEITEAIQEQQAVLLAYSKIDPMNYKIEVANFTDRKVVSDKYGRLHTQTSKNHVGNFGRFKITTEITSDHDGALVKTCVSTHRTMAAAEKRLKSLLKSVH